MVLRGLRLGEALKLSFDDPSELMISKLDGKRPVVLIPGKLDKARKDRVLPLTPDFVEFLRALPRQDGRVFRPQGKQGNPCKRLDVVGRLISEAGEKSNVLVGTDGHPIAHDLRRSFASRWAARVTPAILRELMRHADIKTTMDYYVSLSAERTSNEVRDAFVRDKGLILGHTPTKSIKSPTT